MPNVPEHVVVGPAYKEREWYGRARTYDKRSNEAKFRMRGTGATDRPYRYWYKPALLSLDQGQTSQCCAFGTHTLLHLGPVTNPVIAGTPKEWYDDMQRKDEWAGAEPSYYGTSVNAAMKVARDFGYISGWGWHDDADAVIRRVINEGPVCLGIDWTSDMDNPDSNGYIHPTGEVLGGHFIVIRGASTIRRNPDETIGAVRCTNTGGEWGEEGECWITRNGLQTLLDGLEGWPGEAAAPVEVKRRTV